MRQNGGIEIGSLSKRYLDKLQLSRILLLPA
jgi:hypothetical protein